MQTEISSADINSLIYKLNDDNPVVRELAVEKIVELNDKVTHKLLFDYLLKALNDESWKVRGVVAYILGKTGDKRAINPLIELLDDKNEFVIKQAIESLAYLEAKEPIFRIIEFLNHPCLSIRLNAIAFFSKVKDQRATKFLLPLLKDKNPTVRITTIQVFEKLKDPLALDSLIEIINKRREFETMLVLVALSKIGDKRAVDSIVHLLLDKNKNLREGALLALRSLKDSRATIPIIETFKSLTNEAKIIAIEALGEIKDEKAIEFLISLLNTNDTNIVTATCIALGRTENSIVIDHLVPKLRSSDINVKLGSIKALGFLRDSRSTEILIKELEATSKEIKRSAFIATNRNLNKIVLEIVKALAKIKDKNAAEPIYSFLDRSAGLIGFFTVEERKKIIDALCEIDVEKAFLYFIPSLEILDRVAYPNENITELELMALGSTMFEMQNVPHKKIFSKILDTIVNGNRISQLKNYIFLRVLSPELVKIALCELESTDDWRKKLVIMFILKEYKDNEKVREAFIKQLKGENWIIIASVIYWVGDMEIKKAIEPLCDLITILSCPTRELIKNSIEKIGFPQDISFINKNLKHKDSWIRMKAIESLATLGIQTSSDALIEALDDKYWRVIQAAIFALAKIEGQKAIPVLIKKINDNDWRIRYAVVTALGNIGDIQLVPYLIETLNDSCSQVIEAGKKAIKKIGFPSDIKYVKQLLNHENPWIRVEAVNFLANFEEEETDDLLINSLNDEYWKIRQAAIFVLADKKCSKAVDSLITMLRDNSGRVRQAAAFALGEIKNKKASLDLAKAYNDKYVFVKKSIKNALKKICRRKYIDSLIDALEEEGKEKELALYFFKVLSKNYSIDPIINAMNDIEPNVRKIASLALGIFEDKRVIEPLLNALYDEDWKIRETAAYMLFSMGKKKTDVIEDILKNKDWRIVLAALAGINESNDRGFEKLLKNAINHNNKYVQDLASQILKKWEAQNTFSKLSMRSKVYLLRDNSFTIDVDELFDSKDSDSLILLLKDKDATIRATVAMILGGLMDPRAVTALNEALKDVYPEVLKNVIYSLKEFGDPLSISPLLDVIDSRRLFQTVVRNELYFYKKTTRFSDKIPFVLNKYRMIRQIVVEEMISFVKMIKIINDNKDDTKNNISLLDQILSYLQQIWKELFNDLLMRKKTLETLSSHFKNKKEFEQLKKNFSEEFDKLRHQYNSLYNIEGKMFSTSTIIEEAMMNRTIFDYIKTIESFITKLLETFWKVRILFQELLSQFEDSLTVSLLNKLTIKYRTPQLNSLVIETLEEINRSSVVNRLIRFLETSNKEMQVFVVKILGKLNDKKAVSPLIKLYNKSTNVLLKKSIIEAFGNLKDERALTIIEENLSNPYDIIRKTTVLALKKINNSQAIKYLLKSLKDKNLEVRKIAIQSLGEIGGTQVVEHLLKLLKDKNLEIQKSTIFALGEIGSSEIIEPLSKLLESKKSEIRIYAIESLSKIQDERVVKALKPLIEDDVLQVQEIAISALCRLSSSSNSKLTSLIPEEIFSQKQKYFGEKSSVTKEFTTFKNTILKLNDCDTETKNIVVSELKKSFYENICVLLKKALADDNYLVRLAAVETIQLLEEKNYVELLSELLDLDEYPEVKVKALSVIETYGDPNIVESLVRVVIDRDITILEDTIRILGKIKDKKAVMPILNSFNSESDYSFIFPVYFETLGNLQDKRAVEPLVKVADEIVEISDVVGNIGLLTQSCEEQKKDTMMTVNQRMSMKLKLVSLIQELRDLAQLNELMEPIISLMGIENDELYIKKILKESHEEMGISRKLTKFTNNRLLYEVIGTPLINALGKFDDLRAIKAIVKVFNTSSTGLEEVCLNALSEVGRTNATDTLIKYAKNGDRELRSASIRALKKLGQEKIVKSIKESLKSETEDES